MKITWLTMLLVIGLATLNVSAQMGDQPGHSKSGMHGMESEKRDTDKARCAYDGMLMKISAMVSMKHGDETLYFCNEEQMMAFQKNPERYLKKTAIGNLHVLMNMLTVKEYMDMMQSMGMMAKLEKPNDTHWLNVYLAVEQPVELSGVTVKVIAPDGKVTFQELKYDKMTKSYVGSLSFLESGKYKLKLLLESSEIEIQ